MIKLMTTAANVNSSGESEPLQALLILSLISCGKFGVRSGIQPHFGLIGLFKDRVLCVFLVKINNCGFRFGRDINTSVGQTEIVRLRTHYQIP